MEHAPRGGSTKGGVSKFARAVAAGCRVEQERVREGAQQLREMLVERAW
jgi:hypothetical protein